MLQEHIRPYLKQVAIAVLCMITVAITTAMTAKMIGPTLKLIFINKDETMLVLIPLAVFAIIATGAAANYGSMLSMRYIGQRLVADMQIRLFSHLMKSDLSLFNNQSSSRLISRFTNDINLLRSAFTNVVSAMVKGTLTTVFLVGVMFYENPKLALISLAVFPIAIYPLMRLAKRMRRISGKTQHQLGDFTATLDEIFQGARTVKSYNREEFETLRARSLIEKLTTLYMKAARVQAASSPMMEALSAISIGLVIWYGGWEVMRGATTPDAFMSFIGAFLIAYKPVRSMSGAGGTLQEGIAAAERLFSVIDTPPKITDAPHAKPLIIANGNISFKNVVFNYTPQSRGIDGINIEVPAGKTAALVGLSGGGKSTIINLLLRFYDVDSGSIEIDGQDIKDVTLHSLREAMAFVPQESMLFDDSIKNNIAYGRIGASDDEIFAAAKNASADDFIRAMPQGYDTVIGAHGVRLSGGQRQRIAVARAMLKNAPILLLDEATSSLDNESERNIQNSLQELMKGRTTLVIAHRLSTIVNADIIYVIEGGKMIESGNHASLMEKRGKYYKLYADNLEK